MTKLFWNFLRLSPVVFATTFFATNSTLASEINQRLTSVAELSEGINIGQVTSVSQFSDVQPTDWAFPPRVSGSIEYFHLLETVANC
ncbi:hypothetical protein NUACC21_20880 [Scytonema sp. NUACC21]